MRGLVRVLLFVLVFAFPVVARADSPPDAQGLISRQLEAFAKDDAVAAYGFAAPVIRQLFPNPDAFLAMVKSTYPPVYRHRSVQFGKQSREGDEITQGVVFIDPDNAVWGGVYTLRLQDDGSWKITGCVLMRSAETSL